MLHLVDVRTSDHVFVASGGDEDVAKGRSFFHGDNLEAFHTRLQRTDRVDFSNENGGALATEGLSTAFTNIAITADDSFFTRNHDVGSTFDTVNQAFAAAIEVVEFRFGDAVVDVDRRETQRAIFGALVEAVNTSGGFFRYTENGVASAGVEGGSSASLVLIEASRMRSSSLSGSRSRMLGSFSASAPR